MLCTLVLLLGIDRLWPPDMQRAQALSSLISDRNGRPLQYLLTRDGTLRLPAHLNAIDPKFVALLIAYEDHRFWQHSGVDALALGRATQQWLANRHIVSGGSTLTMQTVRLLEPRRRTLLAKFIEIWRAWQLERRYTKQQILELYLTLAPYGGNREGIEAAARFYFDKPPLRLTPGEAALLVAIPQSPTSLRPDRSPSAAVAARRKVLLRIWQRVQAVQDAPGNRHPWDRSALGLALVEPIRSHSSRLPNLAPHLALRMARHLARDDAPAAKLVATTRTHEPAIEATTDSSDPRNGQYIRSCIDASLQQRAEAVARDALPGIHRKASIALLIVHNKTAEVRAYVGNADYFDAARNGSVDMITATRSPGSTLKPLIYGLAFELHLARPATLVIDEPTRFGQYTPANFEGGYYGTVTLAEALRRSLNVPAVTVLDSVGPVRFASEMAGQGTPLRMPPGSARPGLAIALGGAGISLEELLRHYRALADDGRARPLRLRCDTAEFTGGRTASPVDANTFAPMLGAETRWHLRRILSEVTIPEERIAPVDTARRARIAYKTGTSYGFRDAWALGYDNTWTVGIWVGRPDGTTHPGHYGYNTAAPLLFRIFDELPDDLTNDLPNKSAAPQPPPPGAQMAWEPSMLPPALRMLGHGNAMTSGPKLLFPLPDTTVLVGSQPVQLEVEGGAPPYAWVLNGAALSTTTLPRAHWSPDGPGFVTATVIDAAGRYDHVQFRIGTFANEGTGASENAGNGAPGAARLNMPAPQSGRLHTEFRLQPASHLHSEPPSHGES